MTLLAWRRAVGPGRRAVVLLHGWAHDASVWDEWRERIAATGPTVLACDLPGHGGSAEFAAPRGVDYARWSAQAVIRDLETLGVADPAVVGLSEGCMVAAHLCVDGRVRRAALLDPDPGYPPRHAAEAAAALRDPGARLWSLEASDLVARGRSVRGHNRRALADWLERASWPGAGQLRAVAAPVLVAAGAGDSRRDGARKLAAMLHDGGLTTASASGSALLDDARLVETVAAFLAEPDGPPELTRTGEERR